MSPTSGLTQDYPRRPIRFIVGFGPGGVVDLMARSLGQKLTEAWGQQVIIDNRPGAGGVVCMQIAGKAAPDGYTLLLGSSAQFSIAPGLRPDLPYDPIRDYTPIVYAALSPIILTVHPSHPARSLQELIKLAKARSPQTASYASTGYGAVPHITAELFKRVADIDITHIPYKGGSDAMIALMGGQIPMSFGAVSTSLPHIRATRLRSLGVTSLKRLTAAPDVPTFVEGGLPGFEVVQWFGVFGPAHMPSPLVRKLNETLNRALAVPQFNEHFAAQGIELQHTTPAEFARYVNAELVRWKRTLKELGIKEAP
ncbi:MAG TPA: tripartite tricarboxylate transporter substrate binding protein [Burkholderiales bacterium]|nr:tripartite tricarboxylate transporter substrate binding protein [Burkholderiales bacterium]